MIPEHSKNLFITKFEDFGSEKFYEFLINYGESRIQVLDKNIVSPSDELLDYADKFIVLYRKEKNETYLQISKLFRKAAHKLYRLMLNKGINSKSLKFLRIVKIDSQIGGSK